jgi:hypothetical protein
LKQHVPGHPIEKVCNFFKDIPEDKNYVAIANFPKRQPKNFAQRPRI